MRLTINIYIYILFETYIEVDHSFVEIIIIEKKIIANEVCFYHYYYFFERVIKLHNLK